MPQQMLRGLRGFTRRGGKNMSSFTSELWVSPLPDGRRWKLLRSFSYHVGSRNSRQVIKVPKGRETDFASIPKIFLPLLPFWAKYSKPSPIHDELYRVKAIMGKPITRKKADRVFLEAMLTDFKSHKQGKAVAYLEYWAVRLFGWLSWHKPKRHLTRNSNPQRGQI